MASNTERFNQAYTAHYNLSRRALAPPGRIVPTTAARGVRLGLRANDATELGTITYFVGNASSFFIPPGQEDAPYLYEPARHSGRLPRILIITNFQSHNEHTQRGVGSAMLREVLRIADMADCQYIGVEMGENQAAYEALGFDFIDQNAITWCVSVAKLRARLSPLRRLREAP